GGARRRRSGDRRAALRPCRADRVLDPPRAAGAADRPEADVPAGRPLRADQPLPGLAAHPRDALAVRRAPGVRRPGGDRPFGRRLLARAGAAGVLAGGAVADRRPRLARRARQDPEGGRVMNAVSTYAAQSLAAVRASFADRTNFALQALAMIVNNGFWLALWFMFFAGFKQVGGWRLGDVARLLGIIYTLFGTATVFFGGYRDMAGAILRGEIDPLLTQPKPVLPRMLARESIPSAWGDLTTGLVILAFSAR